jgi:hypothetical protein
MNQPTKIFLHPSCFGEAEHALVRHGDLIASTFTFPTGVLGVRLANDLGHIVVLPYQGQQIWDAQFRGRTLTMRSMFDMPYPTQDYLRTYGGFLLHCGATAMGVPGEADTHPLHGELPNAPYQSAELHVAQDEQGSYLAISGSYQHTVAFNDNYLACPLVKLYSHRSRIKASLTITNLKRSPMELMYLAHINFRPADNGRLVYSAPCTPEHVRVRTSIPSHIRPAAGYREFLQALAEDPRKHNVLAPGLAFDPEVVLFVDYRKDEHGWAHSMQVHPDGSADFVSHRPEQLPHGIRWISRTADQDALGLVEPATAEPEGYMAEKAKGNLVVLPPGDQFHVDLEMGALTAQEASDLERHIDTI